MIKLLDEPIEVQLETINGATMSTLLFGAIVNPYGPTFFGIGSAECMSSNNTRRTLYQFSFNPFSSYVNLVGHLGHEQPASPSDIRLLHRLFQGFGCPTFFCASATLDGQVREQVLGDWFRSFDNARDTAARCLQFLGDPWKRVSRELELGIDEIMNRRLGKSLFEHQRANAVDDPISEFLREAATLRHIEPEMRAFFYAWKGSIEHASSYMADTALPFELAVQLFGQFASSCALPFTIDHS